MTNSRGLQINGRFLAANMTGVHRTALELIKRLDQRAEELFEIGFEQNSICAPHNAYHSIHLDNLSVSKKSFLTGQYWEQIELPLKVGRNLLLNLCNLAPVAESNNVTMIHDAQTFSVPKSYSATFRSFYQRIQPIIGRRSLRVLTVSNFSAQELIRWKIAHAEKIRVIYNGVDHALAYVSNPDVVNKFSLINSKYVLGLATLQMHKNIRMLIETFSMSEMQNLKLVLFGATTAEEFKSAGVTLPPNVVFVGRVTDGELRALMEAAVCLAMPSLTEGFGLPPLEAMLLGCPAVVSPCGALPEVCGDAAIYAASDNPNEWSRAIFSLSEDTENRKIYSSLGIERAATFTWDRAATSLIKVLREIMRENT